MTKVITKQKEDISEKLKMIETLSVSREQKDLLIQYVQLMNTQTIFLSNDNELEIVIN